ncbi:MAG TPA: ABC transporter permease [Cyclobacteriaceae bacterium]|nr:ABC transporter permease [Cyclobacteriaceae bacterium]
MIRNYLTVAFRNILKNKVFSAINIFGLSIGLAACLLIFQFVTFQLSYDTFNEKFERTYRVTNDRFQHGKLIQHGTIMYPTIGPTMIKDYAEIEEYTRMMPGGALNVRVEDRNYRGDVMIFADEHMLSVFTYPLIAGDKPSALRDPHTIVLTKKTASKYFPDVDPTEVVNRTILSGLDQQPYKVTAVLEDIPENSHLRFDALMSYSTLYEGDNKGADNSWSWSDMRHYLVLKPGVDYKTLEAKFPEFSDRYFQGDKVSGSVEKFYLQPLKEAHLYSDYEYDIAETASGKAVWGMLVVAVFILVIAWINYINLTTSRAMERAKEVGLRKVMGAMKNQLMKQFIFESVLVSLIAFVLGIIIVQLLQSSFNEIIRGNLSWLKVFSEMNAVTVVALVAIMLTGILLSGFYPAFILSAYQPVTVLKGKFQRSTSGNFMRKSLVVVQFFFSAALITGTLIVSKQLNYMNDADLGINIDNMLIVTSPELTAWDSTFIQRVENYKQEISKLPGVKSVSTSSRLPGHRLGRSFGIRLADMPADQKYTLSNYSVDYGFFDVYGVKVLAGRGFIPTDHNPDFSELKSVIINESAVKLLGLSSNEDAIGRQMVWGQTNRPAGAPRSAGGGGVTLGPVDRLWTIIGVINDFHQESLKKPKEPIVFRPVYSTNATTSIKYAVGEEKHVIADVEKLYKKFFPGNSFEYSFLEERYNNQYNDDNRFGKVVGIFTFLGIVISCLGLIGLSSYTAVQRTKEIGIRKVLGATTFSIVSLLSFDFIKLVLVATLLSLPLAWYAMDGWLASYPYRITLGWLVFAVPVVLILVIAALTISAQVLKTAMADPARTLKYE